MADFKELGAPAVDETADTPNVNHEETMGNAASKSTRSPAFQFYPKDFLTSPKVRKMPMAERGAYITLLALCWLDGGLTTDLDSLAYDLHLTRAQFDKMWGHQLGHCFYEKNGRFLNERLEVERKSQAEYRRRQTDNANKRWDKRGNATALPERHTSGSALRSSSASSSASVLEKEAPPAPPTRSGPIVRKRNGNAAWEGARGLCVLSDQHARFVAFRNHPAAEAELFAFYEQTAETFAGNIDPNMFRFWDARYAEKWPPPPTAKPRSNEPEWVTRARANKAAEAGR